MDACPAYRGGCGGAGRAARPAVAAGELGCGLLDGERPGVNDLLAHGSFPGDRSVFELGCGTGRLAGSLLTSHLPADARYLGADISDNGGPEQNAPSAVRPPRRGDPGVDGTRPLPTAGGRFDRFLAQGEGGENGGECGGRGERPLHLPGRSGCEHQWAVGGDGVEVGGCAQPGRHGLRADKDIADEREREQERAAGAHDSVRPKLRLIGRVFLILAWGWAVVLWTRFGYFRARGMAAPMSWKASRC